jgi:hypothetical protein
MLLTLLFYAGAAVCAGSLLWFGISVDDGEEVDAGPPGVVRVAPRVVIEPPSSHPSSQHGPWVQARRND